MQMLVAYVTTLVVFLGIDFVWLAFVARKFYFDRIGPLMLERPNLAIAAIFYVFYVVGVAYLAVVPALRDQQFSVALINGALIGLMAYGTYDITNMATLKGWSWEVVIVDMIWGAVLTGGSAVAGYFLTRAILPS